MIRIECPNCKAELEGEDNLAGQKVKCPTCNEDFIAHDKQKLERERREFYEKTLAQKTQPQRPRSLSKKFILIASAIICCVLFVGVWYLGMNKSVDEKKQIISPESKQNQDLPILPKSQRTVTENKQFKTEDDKIVEPTKNQSGKNNFAPLTLPINISEGKVDDNLNSTLKKAMMFKRHGLNADAKKALIELINERGNSKIKATSLHILGMIEFEEPESVNFC